MHAAVVRLAIDAAQASAAAAFTRDILPRLRAAPGLVADYWTEPVDGRRFVFAIFDTEEEARQATPPQSTWASPGVTVEEVEYRTIALGPATAEVDRVKKYETVVSSGQSALKAMLAMNGGAVVVFLTFISHLWDNGTPVLAASMRLFVAAFSWFIASIVLTLMSYGAIFITNCFSSVNWRVASNVAFGVTVACGLVSLLFFVAGGSTAIDAFQSVAGSIIPPP